MCVERVEQGTQDTALWGSYVQGDGVGGELADFHHLMSGEGKGFFFLLEKEISICIKLVSRCKHKVLQNLQVDG